MHRRGIVGLVATAALLVLGPASASAAPAPIQVNDSSTDAPLVASSHTCTSTDSGGGCTLRAAVELADESSLDNSGALVTIDVPAGTFTNTTAHGGTLTIGNNESVAIVGAGAGQTIIDGGGVGSALTVNTNASLTVTGVTIQHGAATDGGGIHGSFGDEIVVNQSTLTANKATGSGGALYAQNSGFQILTLPDTVQPSIPESRAGGILIEQSTISGNTAGEDGGGIYASENFAILTAIPGTVKPDRALPSAEFTIEQSTISGNSAGKDGGAIFEKEQLPDPIVNSTISGNTASEYGGGIYVEATEEMLIADTLFDNTASKGTGGNIAGAEHAEIRLGNTIVAEPAGSAGPGCEGIDESLGHNIDYPSSLEPGNEFDGCTMSHKEHDLVGINPRLDPAGLQENGGPTQTIALLSSSPAIGEVPPADCVGAGSEPLTIDQRGSARPGSPGAGCDIGAYEFSPTVVTPTCVASPNTVEPGHQSTIVCTIEKSAGDFATDVTATGTPPAGATFVSSTPSQGSCSGFSCTLGTIDPATVTFVISPTISGTLNFSASDAETGPKSTAVAITVVNPASVKITPPPAKCASLRDFKLHIQNVKQLKIVSAKVLLDGRLARRLTGKRLRTTIDLRGLPKGAFTVKIVARTRNGHTLTGKRTYHTCRTSRLAGHKHLFL